jgi:FlaA1/EpsC-like NDP-sugar epimerase
MKRQIPLMIVIVLGFMFMAHTFIPHKISQDFYYEWYMDWSKAMSPFAVILGIFSLLMVHGTKIARRAHNWQFSIVTLLGLVVTAVSGFIWGTSNPGTPYMWIFENIQMPMSSTMFSLLAFYIASAAYKAFRARSLEATVLLVAAIIVMLGRVPLGAAITHWIPDATNWILNVPNLAAKRGIALGVGLGMTATSLKIILGIERTYLGGGD